MNAHLMGLRRLLIGAFGLLALIVLACVKADSTYAIAAGGMVAAVAGAQFAEKWKQKK